MSHPSDRAVSLLSIPITVVRIRLVLCAVQWRTMNRSLAVVATIAVCLMALPSLAHQVRVQADVGATLHIEPQDRPVAGTPIQVWFALTQVGGIVIPLEACNCRLTMHDGSGAVIATPTMTATSAEGYEDIPGARVTFPAVGAYELVLTGTPAEEQTFTPFELRFEVTVARQAEGERQAAATKTDATVAGALDQETSSAALGSQADPDPGPAAETMADNSSSLSWRHLALGGGVVLVVVLVGSIIGALQSPGGKA